MLLAAFWKILEPSDLLLIASRFLWLCINHLFPARRSVPEPAYTAQTPFRSFRKTEESKRAGVPLYSEWILSFPAVSPFLPPHGLKAGFIDRYPSFLTRPPSSPVLPRPFLRTACIPPVRHIFLYKNTSPGLYRRGVFGFRLSTPFTANRILAFSPCGVSICLLYLTGILKEYGSMSSL